MTPETQTEIEVTLAGPQTQQKIESLSSLCRRLGDDNQKLTSSNASLVKINTAITEKMVLAEKSSDRFEQLYTDKCKELTALKVAKVTRRKAVRK